MKAGTVVRRPVQLLCPAGLVFSMLIVTLLLALCRLLIERFGYQNTFLITAALKLIAYIPLVPLLGFVDDGMCRLSYYRQPATCEAALEDPLLA